MPSRDDHIHFLFHPVPQDYSDSASHSAIEMHGANYDWGRPMGRPMAGNTLPLEGGPAAGGQGVSSLAEPDTHGKEPHGDLNQSNLTLTSIAFSLRKGELLGICGEVGSGKSSVLAALLGEILPLLPQAGSGGAGEAPEGHAPVIRGTVGYCQQVWPAGLVFGGEVICFMY